jgi:hypothetical protein
VEAAVIAISPCRSASDRRTFECLPERLHGSDLAFVPPVPGSVAKFLRPDSLFNQHDGSIVGFIARRDGRVVGRIAAILNRSHNSHWNDRVGFFGFFACEDNADTARALFDQATETLGAWNCDTMRGPYNPSINEECGLLTEGHDAPPSISMPWNPGYYPRLCEAASLQVVRTLYAYHLPLHIGVPERIQKMAARLRKRAGAVRIRSFDMKRLDEELRLVHRLYNVTLDRNWGFVPVALEDLLASADDLKAFADPDFLVFAELNGEAVGFMLTLPNLNELLIRTKPFPRWLRLPVLAWLLKTRKIRTVRQVILGVAPEHRDTGLVGLLCHDMVVRTQKTADSAELSWIEANNTQVIKLIGLMGATQSKTYGIWEKPVPHELPEIA